MFPGKAYPEPGRAEAMDTRQIIFQYSLVPVRTPSLISHVSRIKDQLMYETIPMIPV